MEKLDAGAMDYSDSVQQVPDGTFYRFNLVPVHGVPLMKPIASSWERIEKFQARPDDLLIATYPKAGTTWMQEIVDCIMLDGDVEKTSRAPTFVRSPFLDICSPPPVPSGIDLLEKTPSPRLVKTHLPYELVPVSFWEKKCKVIYVARNAKDNVVSYYYFDKMNKTQPEPGKWEEYLVKFLKGELAWGCWFRHVLGWWNARDKHDVLYVFYEDMKEDPKREIRKVMEFLGKELSEEVVEKIYQHTSFDAMKENPMANYSCLSPNIMDHSQSPFMRKGEVGDWKNHFTVSQNEMFDKEYKKRMEGSTLTFRYVI